MISRIKQPRTAAVELSRPEKQKARASILSSVAELKRLASGRDKADRDRLLAEAEDLEQLAEKFL